MNLQARLLITATGLLACAPAVADWTYQGLSTEYTYDTAHTFDTAQLVDWQQAVEQYSRLVKEDKSNGEHWFRLAYAQEKTDKPADAVKSYQEAIKLKHKTAEAYLGQARAHASLKKKSEALRCLRMAAVNGLTDPQAVEQEPLFKDYATDEHFKKSVDYIKNPVHQLPEGDALAFWIGEWVFKMTDGTTGGHSLVHRERKGFTIVEHWTSADGTTAQSVYTYDQKAKRWNHTWVSSSGNVSRRTVKSIKDGVEMVGVSVYPDGSQLQEKEILRKLPDGRVEQTISQSFDQGENWIQVSKGTFSAVQPFAPSARVKGTLVPIPPTPPMV